MEVSQIRSSEVSFVQNDIDKKTYDNYDDNINKSQRSLNLITSNAYQSTIIYENERFGDNALWLFSNDNIFRLRIQMIVTHKYFTYAINILIIVNSIFLIFETIDSLKDVSKYSNILFTILFTIECFLKIIAYGFILDNHTYLRDAWNWLDFIVVITSLLTLLPGITANLLALRTFRLIRPLKSISILPTMRIFISTLISSMLDLSIIYLMMFFFLMIFAILGLSLWAQRFHYRCRTVLNPVNSSLPIDPDYATVLCGGRIKCKSEEYCINSKAFYPDLISNEALYAESNIKALNWGLTKFDNILESLFVVFLTTTCEGWAEIMRMYMDGYNYWWSFIYFILCVVINYYFMFNLSVAALLYNFETAKRVDTWTFNRRTNKKNKMDNESILNALGARNSKEANSRTLYRLKYIPIRNVSSKAKVSANIFSCIKITHCFEYLLPQSEYHLKFRFGFYCYFFYKQPITQYFFYFCIFVNSILLTLDRINSSDQEIIIIEIFNIVLVFIFVFEIIILMFSVGMYKFIRSCWNIWDSLIVFASFGEIIIRKATNSESNSSVVSIFRMLRILRIFRLFRAWQNFQVIMNSLSQTLIRMIDYFIIFLLFIYMYSLLGYSFFHDAMKQLDFNFDSFISSVISVFRIVIGDHWQDIFYECHKATEFNNIPTYIFFITLIFFGQITMLNIFLSYLFDNFQRSKKHFEKNIIIKNYIHSIMLFCSKEHEFQLYNPRIQRKKTEIKGQQNIKSLGKYLEKLLEKQILSEGEFVLKNKLKIDYVTGKTIDNEAFLNSIKDHESDILKDYQIKVLFFEKNYKKNKKSLEDRQIDFEDEFHIFKMKYYKPPRKNKDCLVKKTSIIDEIKENIYEDSSDHEEIIKPKRANSASPIKVEFKDTYSKKKGQHPTKLLHSNKLIKLEKQSTLLDDNVDRKHIESSDSLQPLKKDQKCDISISSFSSNKSSKSANNANESNIIEPDNITVHSDQLEESRSCSRSRYSIKGQMIHVYQKSATQKNSQQINRLLQTKTYFQKEPTYKNSTIINKRTTIHSETEINISTVQEELPHIEKHVTIKERFISFKEQLIPIIDHMKQSSLFIFHKNWKIRKMICKLVEHPYFNYSIFGLIICNCIIMCFDNPWLNPNSNAKTAIFWLNRIFNFFFIIEGFLKIVSDNFIFKEKEQITNFASLQKILDNRESPQRKDSTNSIEVVSLSSSSLTSANISWNKMNLVAKEQIVAKANQIISKRIAYLRDPINVLDFICIILSIVDMSITKNLAYLRVLRVFRAIRPIRLLTKSVHLNIMINSLIKSIPALGNVFLLCFLFIFIFGLLGVSLFKKNLQFYCTNITIVTKEECLKAGEHWYQNPNNFTNFVLSLKTNFLIMLADNWGEMMAYAGHKLENRWVYWYYIIYVVVGYLIILNVIVSVLIQNFKFLKEKEKQYKTLTIPEKEWIHLQKVILQRRPKIKDNYETNNKYQEWINNALQSKWFDNTILILTALSIIVLAIQYNESGKGYHIMLDVFSYVLTIIFNVEISAKLFMWKKQFFFSYWNVLDLGIMIIGDIEILLNIITLSGVGEMHTLTILPITLRAFRLLRALREIPSFSNIHSLIDTLSFVLPTIANVGIIVFLVILIYANIGMNVFGTLPLRNVINANVNFRNFVSTSILLFQIATKDNVGEFLHEMSYHNCTDPSSEEYQENYYCFKYDIKCYDSNLVNYTSMNEMNMFNCGSDFSYFYIISFVLIIPLFIMNLCIVMVIEGFSQSMKDNEGLLTRDYMKQFLALWMKYDIECKRIIKPYEFALLIKEIQPAVGINYDGSKESMNLLSHKQRSKYEAYRELITIMNQDQKQKDYIGNCSNKDEIKDTKEKEGKSIVKKIGNAYVFKDGFYLSSDLKNYTNDLEIMILCNKFQISPIEILKEKSEKVRRASIAHLDNTNVLAKDYYIHYIDICLALSRFAICKMMQVNLSKLRLNVVGSYTQKLWLSKFTNDKMIINSFFELKKHREKMSSILATKILYEKLLKKQLLDARNRIIQKKNAMLIEEEEEDQQRILEEIGSIINMNDLEIIIPGNKEPTTLEIEERNIDNMFKNDGIRNSKRKHTGTIDNMNYFFNMKQASHDAIKIQSRYELLMKKLPETPNEFYLEKDITISED